MTSVTLSPILTTPQNPLVIFHFIINLMTGFLKKGLGTIPRQDFELLFEVDYQTEVRSFLTKIFAEFGGETEPGGDRGTAR